MHRWRRHKLPSHDSSSTKPTSSISIPAAFLSAFPVMDTFVVPSPFFSQVPPFPPPVCKMPKRLILCLDGTWDSDLSTQRHPSLPSNIARLSRMIARQGTTSDGNPIEQVVYYQSGVGTGALNLWDRLYQGMVLPLPNPYSLETNKYRRDHWLRSQGELDLGIPFRGNKLFQRRRDLPFRVFARGVHREGIRMVPDSSRSDETGGSG